MPEGRGTERQESAFIVLVLGRREGRGVFGRCSPGGCPIRQRGSMRRLFRTAVSGQAIRHRG